MLHLLCGPRSRTSALDEDGILLNSDSRGTVLTVLDRWVLMIMLTTILRTRWRYVGGTALGRVHLNL